MANTFISGGNIDRKNNMKIVDLLRKYELLTKEVADVNWLSKYVDLESNAKKEGERIYRDNQRMLIAVQELEEFTNRIFEALATHYVSIMGTQYSLAILHYYITNEETFEFDNPTCNYVDYSVCKVPALHPQYIVGKVEYLKTLDRSQMIGDNWGDKKILVVPLKLCDKTESAEFDFMSEVRNVYLKQITSIDV